MAGQIAMTTEQAVALADFIQENADGEAIVITEQGDSIYAAASLASETISADGEREDA